MGTDLRNSIIIKFSIGKELNILNADGLASVIPEEERRRGNQS